MWMLLEKYLSLNYVWFGFASTYRVHICIYIYVVYVVLIPRSLFFVVVFLCCSGRNMHGESVFVIKSIFKEMSRIHRVLSHFCQIIF